SDLHPRDASIRGWPSDADGGPTSAFTGGALMRNGGHFIDDHRDNRSRSRPARSPSGATHCWIATAVVLRSCSTRSRLDRRGTTSPKLAPITFHDPRAAH